MKFLLLPLLMSFSMLVSKQAFSTPLDIEPTSTWTEYMSIDGVTIEYVFQECNSELVSNQTLVLFRYTNTTDHEVMLTWKLKIFMNDECYNCARIENEEYSRSITLAPGEVFTGDCTSKMDKRGYVFSHFINKVPGMSDSKLTGFEFVNVNVVNL